MYRDDRDALLARLEAVTRENGQLRERNAELERPPLSPPDTYVDFDSFLADLDKPQPHQTLRGHVPAWVTRPGGLPSVRVPAADAALARRQPRELATLVAALGFAALVTVGCFLLLVF